MNSLAALGALPPEAITAILKRADEAVLEAVEEELRGYLAANLAWHSARPQREAIEEWVRQARAWRLSSG